MYEKFEGHWSGVHRTKEIQHAINKILLDNVKYAGTSLCCIGIKWTWSHLNKVLLDNVKYAGTSLCCIGIKWTWSHYPNFFENFPQKAWGLSIFQTETGTIHCFNAHQDDYNYKVEFCSHHKSLGFIFCRARKLYSSLFMTFTSNHKKLKMNAVNAVTSAFHVTQQTWNFPCFP